MDTQVLIVGAGPTGLTLAVDLGMRGVRCTLIEQKEAPAFLPKMERCNARTLEIYRRMGIAEKVRAGVDFLITQLFFDNELYFDFLARARAIGIEAPIIPGIMPITHAGQVERMAKMCGASIPDGLTRELRARAEDPEAVLQDYAVLDGGVWKVARQTFCALASLVKQNCPPS